MRWRHFFPVAFGLRLLLCLVLPAQDTRTRSVFEIDGRKIVVLYEHFETFRKEENIFRPYGHVEAVWDQYQLKADFLEIDFKNRRLFADGRVNLADRQSFLSGERLSFDFERQTGEVYETFGLAYPFIKYESPKIRQTDSETMRFDRLEMTSCNQAVPRWKFTCRGGKIKKKDYVEMKNVVLRIKNIPVLYLPYLRYPISKEGKQTGFLFPRIGKMVLKDAQQNDVSITTVSSSFFWNMRSNLDLTLNLDYYDRFGTGIGQELRYLFRQAAGSLRFFSFFYKPGNAVETGKKSDYVLEGFHEQGIPALHSRLSYYLKLPSRMDFLRYLDNNFERMRTTTVESSLSWATVIGKASINATASRWEIFDPLTRTSNVLKKMPWISFNLSNQKLGKLPGTLSLLVSLERTKREGLDVMGEPSFFRDITTQRFRVVPSYQLPLFHLPYLSASFYMGSKNNFYSKSYDPEKDAPVDKPLYITFQEVSATFTGPSFYRIFDGQAKRYKHEITPAMEFNYATKVNNADRLLPVDYGDFPGWSYVRFSISSRLYVRDVRDGSPARELARLELGQSYFFDPKAANFNRQVNGSYPSFSELSGSTLFHPSDSFQFSMQVGYNYYIKAFSRFNAALSYDRSDSFVGLNVSFYSNRNPYMTADFRQNWTGISGSLRLGSPRFPIKTTVTGDYDFTARESRYLGIQLLLDYQCLTFRGDFRMHTVNGSLLPVFMFGVSLGNLGAGSPFFEGGK